MIQRDEEDDGADQTQQVAGQGDAQPGPTDEQLMLAMFGSEPDLDEDDEAALTDLRGRTDRIAEVAGKQTPARPAKGAATQADTGQGSTEAEAGAKPVDKDLARAKAALQRDGWRKELIESLDDQTVREIGLKRAKNQTDIDERLSKLKPNEDAGAAGAKTGTDTGRSLPADNLAAAIAPLKAKLGDDGVNALMGLLGPLFENAAAANQASAESARGRAEAIKTELSASYPELEANPRAWSAVLREAEVMAEELDAESPSELIRTVVEGMYGVRNGSPQVKDTKHADTVRRLLGTSTSPARKERPVAMSQDEREYLAFTALERGEPRENALRILNAR